jgi:hypothetical protein
MASRSDLGETPLGDEQRKLLLGPQKAGKQDLEDHPSRVTEKAPEILNDGNSLDQSFWKETQPIKLSWWW